MDILEVLTHLLTLVLGGALGSFLTFKMVRKNNQQNNNKVSNGSIINGDYINGNNNNKNNNE